MMEFRNIIFDLTKGIERWLMAWECLVRFEQAQIQFPAPAAQFLAAYKYLQLQGSDTPFCTPPATSLAHIILKVF